MGMKHVALGAATAGVAFAVGHFAIGSVGSTDWRQDLLELPQPATSSAGVVIRTVEGTVERKPAGGDWTLAAAGEALAPGESLRTMEGAGAVLKTGLASHLTLEAATLLSVVEAAPTAQRFALTQGRVIAVQRHAGRDLIISTADGSAGVRGEGERFTVFAQPRLLGAINDDAQVELGAGQVFVTVPKGRVSWVSGTEQPVEPRLLDTPPELEVTPLESTHAELPFQLVQGRADTLAAVRVNGTEAERGDDGSFSARVPLREGENRIDVVAQLFTGAQRRIELPVVTYGDVEQGVAPEVEIEAAPEPVPAPEVAEAVVKPAAKPAPKPAAKPEPKPAANPAPKPAAKPIKKPVRQPKKPRKPKKKPGSGVQWGASP